MMLIFVTLDCNFKLKLACELRLNRTKNRSARNMCGNEIYSLVETSP